MNEEIDWLIKESINRWMMATDRTMKYLINCEAIDESKLVPHTYIFDVYIYKYVFKELQYVIAA